MKAKSICETLKSARLFEPDRNEEKWTNEDGIAFLWFA